MLHIFGTARGWAEERQKTLNLPTDSDAARELANAFAASLTIDTSKLAAQMVAMDADAYVVGLKDALESASWQAATDIVASVDWSAWKPGHPVAANLLRSVGFDQVLQQLGITLRGIDATLKKDIGDTLAEALEEGWSVDQTAEALNLLLRDPKRAELIAVTEINRMMTDASLMVYRQHGYTSWDLITAVDPCPVCLNIKAGNPHPLDDEVKPPIHPRCRCAVATHVE